jgi:hypothetical protein
MRSNARRSNDEGAFFILCLCLIAVCVLAPHHKESTRINTPKTVKEVSHEALTKVVPPYTVNYEIELGSIYTGDQTPIVHRGSMTIVGDFIPAANGLPVTGYFPDHFAINFDTWEGEQATLLIPSCATKTISWASCDGAINGFLMTSEVEVGQHEAFVRARPLIRTIL